MKKQRFSVSTLLQDVLSVMFYVVLFVSIGAVVYYYGLVQGYNLARKSFEPVSNYIVEESDASQQVVPFSSNQATIGVNRSSAWGGPDLWEEVNKRRTELGVAPLSTKSELCTIASIRLNELLDLNTLDGHEGFSNMSERREDLKWIFEKYNLTEFLVAGADSPTDAVSLWENTLGHKKLLTGGEYVWGCIYAQNSFGVAITAF